MSVLLLAVVRDAAPSGWGRGCSVRCLLCSSNHELTTHSVSAFLSPFLSGSWLVLVMPILAWILIVRQPRRTRTLLPSTLLDPVDYEVSLCLTTECLNGLSS